VVSRLSLTPNTDAVYVDETALARAGGPPRSPNTLTKAAGLRHANRPDTERAFTSRR
jgi:hypothetical protein